MATSNVAGADAQPDGAQDDEKRYDIDVVDVTLGDALTALARQTDKQLFFSYDLANAEEVQAVSGQYTVDEALDLLLQNSGFSGGLTESGVIIITVSSNKNSAVQEETMTTQNENITPTKRRTLLCVIFAVCSVGANAQEAVDTDDETEVALEEIVVTGTHIRGVEPVGSQLITITREDIDKSGFAHLVDVIQSLPQNFKGGANDADATEGFNNITQGASINLRGVGTSSTLILLNGRRLPIAGLLSNFVDVSTIPTSAIERIEVLPDGASAIYGSDAIGGVVNIILRDDFDGAETVLRYGDVTDGSSVEYRLAQTFGKNWGTGNALISYEYFDRKGLQKQDRAYMRSDLTPFGGDDFRQSWSNPGTITGGTLIDGTRVSEQIGIPSGQDGTSLTPGDLLYGVPNLSEGITGGSLLPDQERHAVFARISQDVNDKFTVFAEARYVDRDTFREFGGLIKSITVPSTNAFFVDPFIDMGGSSSISMRYNFEDDLPPGMWHAEQQSDSYMVGQTLQFGRDWQLSAYASISNEEGRNLNQQTGVDSAALNAALADMDSSTAFNPFADGSNTNPATLATLQTSTFEDTTESEVRAFDLLADGSLFELHGGEVKLATGINYREEEFSSISSAVGEFIQLKRDVAAVFAELFVPLVSENNARPGVERLEFSAAARYEEYGGISNLSTTNPKLGILWSPTGGLNFRGSWGTSFKAPNLIQLNGSSNFMLALPSFPDPSSPTGRSAIIGLTGGNADLDPETATTWTFGIEFTPKSLPELELNLTWFNIDFEDRIEQNGSLGAFLADEERFATRINRNPTPEEIAVHCSNPLLINLTGDPTCSTIEVILDGRFQNTTLTEVAGLDFDISYGIDTSRDSHIRFRLNGSYLADFNNAISTGDPLVDDLDTVDHPTALQMRNSVSWYNDKGWSADVFLNYVNSYTDNISSPDRKIDSWTTVDLTMAYRTKDAGNSFLTDTTFSLSILNLLDEDPPFVNKNRLGYDPTNANGLGRFVSLNINKLW